MRYKCLIADDKLLQRDLIAMYVGKMPQPALDALIFSERQHGIDGAVVTLFFIREEE